MHGRSLVDHDRQVVDATVYRCVGGRVWETLALGYASSYFYPAGRIEYRREMWRAGERKEKSVFSPRERNERSVRPEVRDDTGCCQWAFAHGYHSPSNLRPPNSPPLSLSPPTHPTFPTPPLRASSIIFVRARQPLSLSLSLSVLGMEGERGKRVEMGKTCFPIHRSGQEGRKSAGYTPLAANSRLMRLRRDATNGSLLTGGRVINRYRSRWSKLMEEAKFSFSISFSLGSRKIVRLNT